MPFLAPTTGGPVAFGFHTPAGPSQSRNGSHRLGKTRPKATTRAVAGWLASVEVVQRTLVTDCKRTFVALADDRSTRRSRMSAPSTNPGRRYRCRVLGVTQDAGAGPHSAACPIPLVPPAILRPPAARPTTVPPSLGRGASRGPGAMAQPLSRRSRGQTPRASPARPHRGGTPLCRHAADDPDALDLARRPGREVGGCRSAGCCPGRHGDGIATVLTGVRGRMGTGRAWLGAAGQHRAAAAPSPSRGDQHLLNPGGVALGQAVMPGSPAPGDPGCERAQRAAAVAGVHRVERLHQQTGGSRRSRFSRSSCC